MLSELPLANKVKFGNYWHSVRDVPNVCAKSVRRLVTKEIGDDRFWGMCGSTTLVNWKSKDYALFTRHQISNANPQELPEDFSENYLIPSLRPTFKNLSVTGLKFPVEDIDEEYFDILAFNLNPDDKDVIRERVHFCNGLLGQKVINGSWFYVGYPNIPDSLIYDENHERVIDFKQSVLVKDCKFDEKYQGPDFLKRYTHSLTKYSADGLSGGAIFCLTQTQVGFEVGLDAIITRGNQNYLYGINSNFLDLLLS